MPGRITTIVEGARVALFRFGGAWFILCSAVGILSGLFMLVASFLGPTTERTSNLFEAVALLLLCGLFMVLGVRLVSVTPQEIRDAPAQLANRRKRFEAWINRENKDV